MLTDVDDRLIQRFLGIYNPQLRYLQREQVDTEAGYAFGFFRVPETNVFAANGKPSAHVTESETQLMITQLMWPFFAEMLAHQGLGDLHLSYEEFARIAKHGIFLIEEQKYYRHYIDGRNGLEGKIELVDVSHKTSRDQQPIWFTKVKTELYPPSAYREHMEYNRFEAVLALKPGMVLGRAAHD